MCVCSVVIRFYDCTGSGGLSTRTANSTHTHNEGTEQQRQQALFVAGWKPSLSMDKIILEQKSDEKRVRLSVFFFVLCIFVCL